MASFLEKDGLAERGPRAGAQDQPVGDRGLGPDEDRRPVRRGHGRVEVTQFRNPPLVPSTPANPPTNTLGLRQIMFAVEDLDDTVARLRAHGAELVGEVVQYEDFYRLCYVRGPAGVVIALAQELF